MRHDSKEYIYVPISSSVDLTSQPVQVAFRLYHTVGPLVWTPAVWDEGRARLLHLEDITLTGGTYEVFVRVVDNPEVPVLFAGNFVVT